MLLEEIATTSAAVAATRSRKLKTELLAGCLSAMDDAEVGVGAMFLAGQTTQERLNVGWATLRDLEVTAAADSSLSLLDVDRALQTVSETSGKGSVARRLELLTDLFAAGTEPEQDVLRTLIHGQVRQGALEGSVVAAVAVSTGVAVDEVRRALMLGGSLAEATTIARRHGADGLADVGLVLGRAIQPMLAATAVSVAAAIESIGRVAVDEKLDGARIIVHRDGDDVWVHTRNLREISARLPEVVALVRALDVTSIVLDGESIALDADGRPRAFQETMGRFGTHDPDAAGSGLAAQFFDLLHVDGRDLLDEPLHVRRAELVRILPAANIVRSVEVGPAKPDVDPLLAAMARGQEGVVVKDLEAPYAAGRRGAAWQKVKPVHTLDLVVIGVERGSGRRSQWWSNLHLAARDEESDEFVMLGKTFKGMTDDMLVWQTEHLPTIAMEETTSPDGRWYLPVRPELVVEVAFDGVQTSTKYPGGMALRFARLKGHRPDKDAQHADTLQTVRAIHAGQIPPTPPT